MGPPRPRWGAGAMPRWGVQGGAENEFGYFGDQFAAPQCTEIVKTILLFVP